VAWWLVGWFFEEEQMRLSLARFVFEIQVLWAFGWKAEEKDKEKGVVWLCVYVCRCLCC
jgi:hypothetical protein